MKWIKSIASGIVSPIANIFVKDKELKAAQVRGRVDIAKAEVARKVAEINADADMFSQKTKLEGKKVEAYATAENHVMDIRKTSWLDEGVVVVILAPALFSFVPFAQPYVKKGFEILQTLPDFYQALLVLVVVMTVGGGGLIRDLLGKFKT